MDSEEKLLKQALKCFISQKRSVRSEQMYKVEKMTNMCRDR
jgi:hypothetical protein